MRLLILIPLLFGTPSAFAWSSATSDDVWRSGWGQGTAEAQVTHGSGNEIYVACEDGSGFSSSISFSLAGSGPKGSEVLIIFDNGKPESISVGRDGRVISDSRAGDSTFRYVLANFKNHRKVYIRFSDGRESTFTLNGAAKAIGNCRSTF